MPGPNTDIVRFQFQPNKPLLFLGLVFFPLLVKLGFWQLDRAVEKQLLLDAHQTLTQAQPQDLNRLKPEQVRALAEHTPVKLRGSYHTSAYWLLDNQTFQGRVGYRLIQPFESPNGWLLVDRGWLPGNPDRTLPSIQLPQGPRQLVGNIVKVTPNPLIAYAPPEPGDPRVSAIDVQAMGQQLVIEPLALVGLSPVAMDALVVHKPVVNTYPEKHRGYAVQWFCMAIALLVLLLFANTNLRQWLGARTASAHK